MVTIICPLRVLSVNVWGVVYGVSVYLRGRRSGLIEGRLRRGGERGIRGERLEFTSYSCLKMLLRVLVLSAKVVRFYI